MSPLQIAMVGAGQIGSTHASLVLASNECRLHSLVDPSPAARALAHSLGVPWHNGLSALLDGQRPDAAIIASPNALHVPQALALLQHGLPLLVEKPLSDTLEAGEQLLRASRGRDVPVLVGHHRRHGAALRRARTCVQDGDLGDLVALNSTVLLHKPASYFDLPWRRSPGGGPVLINGVHEIDSLRWLAGEVVSVQACSAHSTRRLPVEDTAAVLLRFACGALGTMILSDTTAAVRNWEQTSGENAHYARDPSQDSLFLAGTRGSLAIPTMTRWRAEGPASWTLPLACDRLGLQANDPLAAQLQHFCAVVRGEQTPLVDLADALATLKVTLAVHQAAHSGLCVLV